MPQTQNKFKLFLLAVFLFALLFSSAGEGRAATVTINPDKTISINGVKTFPVSLWGYYYDYSPTDLIVNPENNKDFTFWTGASTHTYPDSYSNWNKVFPKFVSANMKTTIPAINYNSMTSGQRTSSVFFGYMQEDEPDNLKTAPSELIALKNQIRAVDNINNGHPIMGNFFQNLWGYKDTADILM